MHRQGERSRIKRMTFGTYFVKRVWGHVEIDDQYVQRYQYVWC